MSKRKRREKAASDTPAVPSLVSLPDNEARPFFFDAKGDRPDRPQHVEEAHELTHAENLSSGATGEGNRGAMLSPPRKKARSSGNLEAAEARDHNNHPAEISLESTKRRKLDQDSASTPTRLPSKAGQAKRIGSIGQPAAGMSVDSLPPSIPPPSLPSTKSTPVPREKLAQRDAGSRLVLKLLDTGEIQPNLFPSPSCLKRGQDRGEVIDAGSKVDPSSSVTNTLASDGQGPLDLSPSLIKRYASAKAAVSGLLPPPSRRGPNNPVGVGDYSSIVIPGQIQALPTIGRTPETLVFSPYILRLQPQSAEVSSRSPLRLICLLMTGPLELLSPRDHKSMRVDGSVNNVARNQPARIKAEFEVIPGASIHFDEEELDNVKAWTEMAMRAVTKKRVKLSNKERWLLAPVRPLPAGMSTLRDSHLQDVKGSLLDFDLLNGPLTPQPFPADPTEAEAVAELAMMTSDEEFATQFYVDAIINHDPAGVGPKARTVAALDLKSGGYLTQLYQQHHRHQSSTREKTLSLSDKTYGYYHPLPSSVFRTLTALPAFFLSLDDLLVAQSLSRGVFQGKLTTELALKAIQCPNEDYGLETNYERLELFGDALLKLITAFWVFNSQLHPVGSVPFTSRSNTTERGATQSPAPTHESRDGYLNAKARRTLKQNPRIIAALAVDDMHLRHYVLLSNASLRQHATRAGVPKYIRNKRQVLRLRDWIPSEWTLEDMRPQGSTARPTVKSALASVEGGMGTQKLGDKVIADVAEALIAAAYLSCSSQDSSDRLTASIETINSLGIPIVGLTSMTDVFHALRSRSQADKSSSSYGSSSITPGKSRGDAAIPEADVSWMKAFQPRETIWEYEFHNAERVRMILTMSQTLTPEETKERGRLKMLGDALLDYFLMEHFYQAYPNEPPSTLTNMRHARHNDSALAALTVCTGLSDRLTDIPADSIFSFKQYVKAMQAGRRRAEDRIKKNGGDVEVGQLWWNDVPQIYAVGAPVQILMAAVFLDAIGPPAAERNGVPSSSKGQAKEVSQSTGKPTAIDIAHKLYFDHFHPFFERFCPGPNDQAEHPKSRLNVLASKKGCKFFAVELKYGERGAARGWAATVKIHGTVISEQVAESRPLAVRRTCEEALRQIDEEGWETWCDCAVKRQRGTNTTF